VWVMPTDFSQNQGLSKRRVSHFNETRFAFVQSWFARLAISVLVVSSLVATVFFLAPNLYYQFLPASAVAISSLDQESLLGGKFADGVQATQASVGAQVYQPAFDPDLPEGEWLSIPRIGVRSALIETPDSAEALKRGLWLVPGYGHPADNSLPIIVAAHRFGWSWWWQSDYWQYNSFYRLPETEPGDVIEVIADQRKWIYEIYAGEEVDEITDYDADLILYTCKFLNSPIRHIRYARLIDPTQDTQSALGAHQEVRI